LAISNEYIELTGEYVILTKKREDLADMLADAAEPKEEEAEAEKLGEDEQILDWNDESEKESSPNRLSENTKKQKGKPESSD
jgi:hypothetical protein